MESGYPLNPYPSERLHDFSHSAYPSAFSPPEPYHQEPVFPTGSKLFDGTTHHRASRGYQPLSETYQGGEYLPPVVPTKPRTSSHWLWWMPELFASLLACVCLAAIVITLRVYNGRSLSSVVLPASLTLNGIIAAIATLARVALMVPVGSVLSQASWLWFARNVRSQQQRPSRLRDLELADAASRGSWGSLVFILRGSGGLFIAYAAALLTIISLAFGTATQQLLAVDQYPVTEAAFLPGNLPRAETWQFYDSVPAEEVPTPPFRVRASIYNGFLSDKIDPVTVNCATGNCTWPITPSLAVCGACSPSGYIQQCNQTACTYTMPSGANLTLTDTASEGIGFAVAANYKGGLYNRSSGDRLYLINFDMIGAEYMSLAEDFNMTLKMNASECALWLCIQSFDTRMVAGKLEENVTSSFSDLVRPTTVEIQPFDNYTFADLPAAMHPSPGVTYNVSSIGLYSLTGGLGKLCTGYGFLDLESSSASSDTVDAIWHASADPDPWVKTIATSMTNAIRYDDPNPIPPSRQELVPAPNRTEYDGTAYQLGVRVQWPWLTLPVACVICAILLLVAAMVQTARSPIAPWKASLLAFLFLEPDASLKPQAAAGLQHWSGLYNTVGANKVTLKEDSGGRWSMKLA